VLNYITTDSESCQTDFI